MRLRVKVLASGLGAGQNAEPDRTNEVDGARDVDDTHLTLP